MDGRAAWWRVGGPRGDGGRGAGSAAVPATVRAAVQAIAVAGLACTVAACDGSDDDVAAPPPPPVAVVDPCPAITSGGATPPVAAPYVCGIQVGVADLEKSVAFYKALGLQETGRLRRTDRDEVVLASPDGTGSHLVLFHHLDAAGRDYRRNPGKVVFYAKDAVAFGAGFARAGGVLSAPPVPYQGTLVGFGRDLDNNLVEIAQSATAVTAYLSAVGLGVSNLEAARTQYLGLGFQQAARLSVSKPDGQGGTTPWYDEYILVSPSRKGASVVLMTYTDGQPRNYTDVPVAVGLRVPDPAAFAQAAGAAGATVVSAPAASAEPVLGGLVTGTARDADGTLLHFHAAP